MVLSPGRGTGETQSPGEFCTFECICVAIMNFRVFVVVVVQKSFLFLPVFGST